MNINFVLTLLGFAFLALVIILALSIGIFVLYKKFKWDQESAVFKAGPKMGEWSITGLIYVFIIAAPLAAWSFGKPLVSNYLCVQEVEEYQRLNACQDTPECALSADEERFVRDSKTRRDAAQCSPKQKN